MGYRCSSHFFFEVRAADDVIPVAVENADHALTAFILAVAQVDRHATAAGGDFCRLPGIPGRGFGNRDVRIIRCNSICSQ